MGRRRGGGGGMHVTQLVLRNGNEEEKTPSLLPSLRSFPSRAPHKMNKDGIVCRWGDGLEVLRHKGFGWAMLVSEVHHAEHVRMRVSRGGLVPVCGAFASPTSS